MHRRAAAVGRNLLGEANIILSQRAGPFLAEYTRPVSAHSSGSITNVHPRCDAMTASIEDGLPLGPTIPVVEGPVPADPRSVVPAEIASTRIPSVRTKVRTAPRRKIHYFAAASIFSVG